MKKKHGDQKLIIKIMLMVIIIVLGVLYKVSSSTIIEDQLEGVENQVATTLYKENQGAGGNGGSGGSGSVIPGGSDSENNGSENGGSQSVDKTTVQELPNYATKLDPDGAAASLTTKTVVGQDLDSLKNALVSNNVLSESEASNIDGIVVITGDVSNVGSLEIDTSKYCSSGETVAVVTYDESKKTYSYVGKATVGSDGKVTVDVNGGSNLVDFASKNENNEIVSDVEFTTDKSTYSGKDITSMYEDGSLYKNIKNGTFEGIGLGDKFTDEYGHTWVILDFDYYLEDIANDEISVSRSQSGVTEHHAVIISADILMACEMANRSTAYTNSSFYKTKLDEYYNNFVSPTFGEHIISFKDYYPTPSSGCSAAGTFYDVKLSLMNTIQVGGPEINPSTYDLHYCKYDAGIDNTQFAAFQNGMPITWWYNEDYLATNSYGYAAWLRISCSSNNFRAINAKRNDISSGDNAQANHCIFPYFLID